MKYLQGQQRLKHARDALEGAHDTRRGTEGRGDLARERALCRRSDGHLGAPTDQGRSHCEVSDAQTRRNAPGGGEQVEARVDQTDLEHALENGARRVAEQETERDLTGTEPADGSRELLRASVGTAY